MGPDGGRGAATGRRVALEPAQIAEFLSATDLFRHCDRIVVDRIAPHVQQVEAAATAVILRAGAVEPSLGVVLSGRLALRRPGLAAGSSVVVEELRAGDFFGEVGAVLGTAQPADVVAEEDSVILVLGKELLAQLGAKVAPFAYALARRLATQVAHPPAGAVRAAPAAPGDEVIRFVRIARYDINDRLLALIPAKVMQQHRLLPLELRGHTLTVGMVDPFNGASQGELRRVLTTVDVDIVAIGLDDFSETFVRLRIDAAAATARRRGDSVAPDSLVFDVTDQERDAGKAIGNIGEEVVALASRIVAVGIERGASDIHIEGDTAGMRIRYRVHGQLYDWDQYVAPSFHRSLVARLKVLSGLDVTERRLPLDGRIGIRVGRREVDLRVSTLPASRGEKVVLRLFEASALTRPLESIFLEPHALTELREVLNRPYGALVVAGPTGSGKTSTLYAALGERRRTRPDTNIITVEDPIEYRLAGITQVQVNYAVELTFSKVLRAMLRQDPDVIMVGEVRDPETAQLALEAAMTGHLLFTSLHANNAVSAIQRLENLGCPRALIGQALTLVIVQRLARRLCSHCATSELPPPVLVESLAARGLFDRDAPVPLPRAVGCPDCSHTGYSGRIAVVEMMELTDALRAQVMAGVPLGEIEKSAIDGSILVPFRRYASYLMSKQLLTPTDALLTVA